MTMRRQDAARALGVAPTEVREVSADEHGTRVRLTSGAERLITDDGVFACDDHPANKNLRRWTGDEDAAGPQQLRTVGREVQHPPAGVVPAVSEKDREARADETGPEGPVVGAGDKPGGEDLVAAGAGHGGDDVPEGPIEEVLDWVGNDRDRARRALEAEQLKDKPRKSLVERLREITGDAR